MRTRLYSRAAHAGEKNSIVTQKSPLRKETSPISGPASVRTHYDQRVTWRPRYRRPPSETTPIRPGLRKTAIVFPINYIAPPSSPVPLVVPPVSPPSLSSSLRARTCSGLGHGLNTMDRRKVQSHQTQRRDLRADNRFEKLSRTPDWRIAVFVVNQNAWFTCIVNLALCTSRTSCLYMYNQLPPGLRIVFVA